ncbi:RNA polymerase II elongation factor ELL2-like [Sabethes cyaneus]|uniref:RNA polymerase II elongation factor ELL2-like n=1 Tax=Sabethes cyaneus TaxID=53552 RepID=UPI00237EE0F2|nr:RNA polymerase II elongation factor ELL2-like [Sabethes cyaneus]
MAAFNSGKYGLAQPNPGCSKSVIHVKLTDSMLRAIESQLAGGSSMRPQMQVIENGRQGHISFGDQKFTFTVSDIEGSASTECVKQSPGQQLHNVAHIGQKMDLQDSEDVYEKAKQWLMAQKQKSAKIPVTKPDERINREIMKRSIRERLIHLLAVKACKKAELVAKLTAEGIREEEQKCITQVLNDITTFCGQVYVLRRHIWKEVKEDWPFYSEQERQAMKKRKPRSDTGSSTSKQSSANSNNLPIGGKRRLDSDDVDMRKAKEPRLADHSRKNDDGEHEEYLRLHEAIQQRAEKFAQLEEELIRQRERYKEIEKTILEEYNSAEFLEKKARYAYLRKKLSSIDNARL